MGLIEPAAFSSGDATCRNRQKRLPLREQHPQRHARENEAESDKDQRPREPSGGKALAEGSAAAFFDRLRPSAFVSRHKRPEPISAFG